MKTPPCTQGKKHAWTFGQVLRCVSLRRGVPAYVGTLVHIFPGGTIPQPRLVSDYYGAMAPLSAFRVVRFDRLVIEREGGGCVVIPNNPEAFRVEVVR
jgi:hypothetical protein